MLKLGKPGENLQAVKSQTQSGLSKTTLEVFGAVYQSYKDWNREAHQEIVILVRMRFAVAAEPNGPWERLTG